MEAGGASASVEEAEKEGEVARWNGRLFAYHPAHALPRADPEARSPASDPDQARRKARRAPWGFPKERWPTCKACGGPQSFLGQLAHHAERLDLGADGRVLYLFMCNHRPGECETWSWESGTNGALILEPAELTQSSTAAPAKDLLIETEARISGWRAEDDGVAESDLAAFFDDESWAELDEELVDEDSQYVKFDRISRKAPVLAFT